MLCSNCTQKIYSSLSKEELAILYYVYGREAKLKESLADASKSGLKKLVHLVNDAKTISKATAININKTREIIGFFLKIGAIRRDKYDHAWDYSIDETGKPLLKALEEDTVMLNSIRNYLKEVANRA